MLKKQLCFCIVILCILGADPFYAQQNSEDQDQLEKVFELGPMGLLNKGIIAPNGGEKQTVIAEYLSTNPDLLFFNGMPSQGNVSSIYQEGDYNQAALSQKGNSNNFGLLQKGDNNQYEGTINGDENLIRVLQLGNDNRVFQDLEGNNMRLVVFQEGNNHEVIQIEKDGASPAYQIHQKGEHGMKITIEHLQY